MGLVLLYAFWLSMGVASPPWYLAGYRSRRAIELHAPHPSPVVACVEVFRRILNPASQ
jgi:hypothetical protein